MCQVLLSTIPLFTPLPQTQGLRLEVGHDLCSSMVGRTWKGYSLGVVTVFSEASWCGTSPILWLSGVYLFIFLMWIMLKAFIECVAILFMLYVGFLATRYVGS